MDRDPLPAEPASEDTRYHVYVQQAIRRGLKAIERGEIIDQDEFDRRMAKWLGE